MEKETRDPIKGILLFLFMVYLVVSLIYCLFFAPVEPTNAWENEYIDELYEATRRF